jgi:hypothetical protein
MKLNSFFVLTLFSWGQLFLGVPKEVLSTAAIAMLWAGKYGGFHRLFLYSLHEAEVKLPDCVD